MDSGGVGSKSGGLWPGQNLRSYIKFFVWQIKNIVHSEIKVLLKTISFFLIHFTSLYPQYAVCEINKSTGKNNFLNFQTFSFSFCT